MVLLCSLLLWLAPPVLGQAGRIYTQADPAATGGISVRVDVELTHAMAVEHDRVHVYLAELAEGGQAFRFDHLPVGKYDLVLVGKTGTLFEGLMLGGTADSIGEPSLKNLKTRIEAADSFFNLNTIHRFGLDGTTTILALVERISSKHILKQSGEALNQNLRRLEVIELHQADDDWQMVGTRHLYREGEPVTEAPAFFKHAYVPELGNIRVVDSVKDLAPIHLPLP